MNPTIRILHAVLAALVLLTGALAGCATRGPARMRIAVVGASEDQTLRARRTAAELEERLVGGLLEAPRVEPRGGVGFSNEPEPLIYELADAPDDAEALARARRRALTHLLLVDVSEGDGGPRAELRALAVATGAVVWRASWSSEGGALGAAVEPWIRHLLEAAGFSTGLPPPTEGPARRAVADLIWRGYQALDTEDAAAAEEALGEALRRDPRAIRALQGMARLRALEAQDDAALEAAERALAIRPELVSSQVFTAAAAIAAGRSRAREVEGLEDQARAARDADPAGAAEADALDARAAAAREGASQALERAFALAEGPRPLVAGKAALAFAELRGDAPEAAAAVLDRALERLGRSLCGLGADGRPRACERSEVLEARYANSALIAALGRLSVRGDLAEAPSSGAVDPTRLRSGDRDCAGATPLHAAAAAGDGAGIDRLVAAGAAVDVHDDHGWTPLHRAARADSAEAVGRLLAAGADPAARDLRGRTPLMVAVSFEALAAVRALAPRTPLEARTRGFETALHFAAAVGSVSAIQLLFGRGARVDAPSWDGRTPLMVAAKRGHVEAVAALVAGGADPDALDSRGISALQLVAEEGAPAGVRALVRAGAGVDAVDDLGRPPLVFAILAQRADNVRALLALGASPTHAVGTLRRTPLHFAAERGGVEVVRALLDGGAPIDALDEAGRSPLAVAALAGHADVVGALLGAGADARLADASGRSPLELAVVARRAEVVAAFRSTSGLSEGVKSGGGGCTLLLLGARAGTSTEVAMELIAGGCSPELRDERGRTAAMVAAAHRRSPLALFLAEQSRDLDARDDTGATLLHHAARADDLELVTWLLGRRPGLLDARDARGWSPLHAAAAGGALDVMKALVEAGADPRALTRRGADTAHVAAAFGHTWLVEKLLRDQRRVADLELAAAVGDLARLRALGRAHPERLGATGVTGMTPLMIAVANEQVEVVAALLEMGVDPEVAAKQDATNERASGTTAIVVADRVGARELVYMMVAFGVEAPPAAEKAFDEDVAERASKRPRFMELFSDAGLGRDGFSEDSAAPVGADPVVPAGAEPLGVQIRERTPSLDVLARGEVLDRDAAGAGDDGWDAVVQRCVAERDHASAARELEDQLVLRGLELPEGGPALGLVHHNLGRVDTYLARYDDAERELAAAADSLRATPVLGATVSVARADLRAITGRHAEAERLYDQALGVWEADDAYAPLAWIEHVRSALANLYTETARYDEARDAFAALVADREGAEDALAIAYNNQAVLFDLLGDHAAATRGYETAHGLLTPRADAPLRAVIASNLAFARLRGGDAQGAVRLASGAVERLDAPPWKALPHYARGRALVTWARAEVALGDLVRAGQLLARAERELRVVHGDVHGVVADVVRRRASLDLLEGRTEPAVERLVEALAIARLADSPEHAWRVEDDLARALVAAGRPRAAAAMDKLAVNTLQGLRARVSGVGATLARAYLAERTAPYRRLAGLLIDAGRVMEAQLVLDMLKDEEAYAFTRATRGSGGAPLMGKERVAADAVARAGRAVDMASREALKKYLRGFKRAVAAALLAVDEDDEQAAASIEARLDQLSLDRLDDLRAFLEDPAVADEHVAFLQIFLTDDRIRLLLTLPEQETQPFESKVRVRRVYQLVSRLREQLQDERSDPRAAARELYDALLRPVRATLDEAGVQTLMVWLDGALRYAPLAALHDGDGWLVERFRLAMYTPVTHAALKDRRHGAWRVNAFGMSKEAPGFDPLPGVPDELDAIVARADVAGDTGAMKGAIWLDEKFTEETLDHALRDEGVQAVHVASHYAFDPEGDEGSYLLLGDRSHMTLHAIRAIARKGRLGLMTFSACNTAVGLGALAGAESANDPLGLEIEGLGNVVQRELATAVLATLWPVVDTSTVAFMRELYGALEADPTLSKAAAVQRAQLRLLRGEVDDGHPKSWVHPRFWAPFVLMGNWR